MCQLRSYRIQWQLQWRFIFLPTHLNLAMLKCCLTKNGKNHHKNLLFLLLLLLLLIFFIFFIIFFVVADNQFHFILLQLLKLPPPRFAPSQFPETQISLSICYIILLARDDMNAPVGSATPQKELHLRVRPGRQRGCIIQVAHVTSHLNY